ncbi:MAG: potassium transporter TrkG [Aquificaceae bacterium]|nr:potassium transporter TrkG [Aquificaceae bacterium]
MSFENLSTEEKLLASLFHSVSARTAGFNTIDLSNLSEASQFVLRWHGWWHEAFDMKTKHWLRVMRRS